jgi:hypothetical protein
MCQSNLKNIGAALEQYHEKTGAFPEQISSLEPDYLVKIPRNYESDFNQKSIEYYKKLYGTDISGYKYEVSDDRQAFTVYCPGYNHADVGVGLNYPIYVSGSGLIPRGPDYTREKVLYW